MIIGGTVAGSLVGDTTTIMMWIDGVDPFDVVHASVAAIVALVVFGIPAALQQHRHQPITADVEPGVRIDWVRVGIVGFILASAIGTNVYVNLRHVELADRFPFIGVAVLCAILLGSLLRRPDWGVVPEAAKGALFLLSLVLRAPMLWFGSTAGIALSNRFPQARSVGAWLRHGWHVALGHVVGFIVMLLVIGWNPHEPHRRSDAAGPAVVAVPSIQATAVPAHA